LDVVSTRKSKVPAIQIGMILPKNRANTWIAGKKVRAAASKSDKTNDFKIGW
jgi:hypothetical protein